MIGKQCKICGEKFWLVSNSRLPIHYDEFELGVKMHIVGCMNDLVQKSIFSWSPEGELNA